MHDALQALMESPTRPGCRSIFSGWDLIKAVIVHCAGCPSFELAHAVFFRRFALPFFIGGEEIGDLELLWTAESLPPAEDRPEMMMTKPGKQHEEVER
jgi:hypothetical protein